jgi:tetratricopeptide (TPR) repeat protein
VARSKRRRAAGAQRRVETPAAAAPRGFSNAALAALFAALAVVAYWRGLHAPFYFDDLRNIVHNPLLRDLSWFARPWDVGDSGADSFHLHAFKTRFVAHLSFALNYRFGALDVTGYHVVGLALHLSNALLVGLVVRRALRLPAFSSSSLAADADRIAIVAAGLFALHPIQTEAVIYTVQRAAVLAAGFCLLSFWFYLRALAGSGRARWGWAAAALAALAAASLSKQNAVIFPLVVVLFDLLFVERERRARLAWLALPALALLIVPLQQLYLVLRSVGGQDLLERATTLPGAVGRLDYLFTETRVVVRYLALLLVPAGQTLEHDVAWSRSLWEPAVLASAALLAALLAGAVWLARRRAGREGAPSRFGDSAWRLVGFGALWFFLCLAVESSVIPIPDAMLEHRLYLPSVGFFVAVAAAVALAGRSERRRLRLGALAGVAVVLAVVTFQRSAIWADEARFWADLVEKSPRKPRVLYNAGYFALQRGHGARARELLERAVAADPGYAAAWVWLGHLARRDGDAERAIASYRSAAAADPKNWATLVDLRIVLLRNKELEEAERIWHETIRLAGSEAAVVEALRKMNAEWAVPAGAENETP